MNILSLNGEDICGISSTLSDAVNKYTKHKSRVFCRTMSVRHVPYDLMWGINCDEDKLREMIDWADILHFNDALPSYPCGHVDWVEYLAQGKKAIMTQHGTYLRTNLKVPQELTKLGMKLLVTMPNMFDYADDEECRTEWLPFPIPTNDPHFMPVQWEDKYPAFTMVHSPGEAHRWSIKDTEFFLAMVDSINNEQVGNVAVKLHTNMPWAQALREKQKSHVCFDHMQGYYGVNTAEAMSMGLPTITNLGYAYYEHARKRYKKELPLVTADRVTLKTTIQRLRDDKPLIEEIGMESRKYAVKVHDLRTAVLPQLMHAYKEVYDD